MQSTKSMLWLAVLATLAVFTNGCAESGVTCTGKLIKIKGATTTVCGDPSECSAVCSEYDECVAWTYNVNNNKCSIYATRTSTKKNSKYVTGSRDCDGETTSEGNTPAPTLAPTPEPTECSTWRYGMFVGSGDVFMLSKGGVAEPEDCEALCAAETDFKCVCWSHHRNGASKNRICELYKTRPKFVEQPQSSKWTSGPFACPTANPTAKPTSYPTDAPTRSPTPEPTAFPTDAPTRSPTPEPTAFPTDAPTRSPTPEPTAFPTDAPTRSPTPEPTAFPTDAPTPFPTPKPTAFPTVAPTDAPITVEELTPAPTSAPIYQCTGRELDIMWIMDNSASIDQNSGKGSAVLQELLPRLADAYTLSNAKTRFAGLAYSTKIRGVSSAISSTKPVGTSPFNSESAVSPFNFAMDQSLNTGGKWDAFAAAMTGNGNTNTPQALQAANYIMGLSNANGGPRSSAIKIVILFTDGNPNMRAYTSCGDIPTDDSSNTVSDMKDMACTEWLVYQLINNHDVYFINVQIGKDIKAKFLQYCLDLPAVNGNQPLPIQTIKATFDNIQDTVDNIIQASCIDSTFATPQDVTFKYTTANTCANQNTL